jgi:hypothetical protein
MFFVFLPFFILQQFLMRDEKRRFADFLVQKMMGNASNGKDGMAPAA